MKRLSVGRRLAMALVALSLGAGVFAIYDSGRDAPATRSAAEPESDDAEYLAEEEAEKAEEAAEHKAAMKTARAEGTFGLTGRMRWVDTPGWARSRLWDPSNDDWEPALAADPREPWVYQSATRYYGPRACGTCPRIAIVVRASSDGGRTWGPDHYMCECPGVSGQYDSLLEVAEDGTLFGVWMNGFHPGVSFAKSADHGVTWTDPINFPTNWSDKPVLGISRDGRDVYIGFNGPTAGDIWVAQSHDSGATFTTSKVQTSDRYYFDGAVWVSRNGVDIAFAENDFSQDYTGEVGQDVMVSHDRGRTWQTVQVDVTKDMPDCSSRSCYYGYYGTVPGIAGDDRGNLVFAYVGTVVPFGQQGMFVARSTDGGLTWSKRQTLSPTDANAVSATAIGTGNGDIRVWWMDDRTGRFNVWYRESSDGGLTWTAEVRISNAVWGVPYVNGLGFKEMYGDYGEMAITNTGATVATWGQGPSVYGPGGIWFNRQT